MCKTNVTSQMVLDFFAGMGTVPMEVEAVVERLMTKIIENLLASGNAVSDLEDGKAIAAVLLDNYYIEVSADRASEYFKSWVEAVRKRARCWECLH